MTATAPGGAGFLYPFLDSRERDPGPLLADLAASARAAAAESAALRRETLARCGPLVGEAGLAMAERFARGGRLYTFGNGGSSTDAAALAALFADPPAGRPLPAWSLAADEAVLTALGNDVGFDLVFARQVIAHAGPDDIAIAMSTSGASANLRAGLAEAARRGLLTAGFAGYDGGPMATDAIDYCFAIRSQSVHRIQESQALLGHALWAAVQQHLPER